MYFEERYNKILEILKARNSATVHYLAKTLFVSEPTIRRDLTVLEQEGKLKRTFGGAILATTIKDEIPINARRYVDTDAKSKIAQQAVTYLRDGMTIFLDASTTAYELFKKMSNYADITVITNNPLIPLEMVSTKNRCISTGGLLLKHSLSFVGKQAEECVSKFNADVCFFSTRGLALDGSITDSSIEDAEMKKAMIRNSAKSILLCTASKLNQKYLYTMCNVNEIDGIICDVDLPDAIKQLLNK